MKVLKFGGSSVAKPERIEGIIEILKNYYERGEKITVVFSAFGGVTDALIEMSETAAKGKDTYQELFDAFHQRHLEAANELINEDLLVKVLPILEQNHAVLKNLLYGIFLVREASLRTMDYVLSFGERNSAFIIAHALQSQGIPASYLDARKVIKTDKSFGNSKVDFEATYKKIQEHYRKQNDIQIVTGFVASAKGGLTTTLGRGGSDYTAALLAAGLEAKQIEIWTDVSGVLTCDPRKVKRAFTIPKMTYAEAMEMSHFGAKVIYPPTLQPALKKGIPLYIKNTFQPEFEGTYISDQTDPGDRAVKGISSIGDISLLTLSGSGLFGVPGIAARLFNALALAKVNIVLITQGSSENAISFAVAPKFAEKAKLAAEKAFEYEQNKGLVNPIKIERNLSAVAIIGENMRYRPGIAGRMFQALGKNGINAVAIAQGSSELNISVVINKVDELKALNALHESFFLSDKKELHLFLVGVGLIGGTLLEQIREQQEYLRADQNLEIKVVGLANSRKMLFDEQGIDLANWKTTLLNAEESSNLASYVERMRKMNLSNTIFVDNTASSELPKHYAAILDSSISISTPNKIATSSSYEQYLRLKQLAKKRGVQFVYETNVGAGLPVLSTLKDLIHSGDHILKIEGVISGSMSFIFNNFDGRKPFSEIVKQAKEKGYTEPDPREDLGGKDMRRKLIILAREAGFAVEEKDITINSILPETTMNAVSVEAFFEELVKSDEAFVLKQQAAANEGKVLRMVAKFESGSGTVGLESYPQDHPFFGLNGSDNMIVFTTNRYKETPLVVRGPGAGAEVTAAGVFAEIIRIGNYLDGNR
ncbi:MAG: bifunctional aspartate kinase/homoserine dehydrogenase I [Bacteroidota bacterium]